MPKFEKIPARFRPEWHVAMNKPLRFEEISRGSSKKVWWKCILAPSHIWDASPSKRVGQGQGCPFCAGKRVNTSNSLERLRPEIAMQWHSARNGDSTPRDVTISSNKVFWWQCSAAPGHEWQASVNKRTNGRNCPFCVGKKVCNSNSLISNRPDQAKLWHPTKNGVLTPADITSKSSKKIWWQCSVNKTHCWQSPPGAREVNKCIQCEKEKLFQDAMSLAAKHNGKLLSKEYQKNSTKLDWECEQGHNWQALLSSVKSGSWCPKCRGGTIKTIEEINLEMEEIFFKTQFKFPVRVFIKSKVYRNRSSVLLFKCSVGHVWKEKYAQFLEISRCRKCYPPKNAQTTINEVKKLAVSKGGRCLAESVKNSKDKLLFVCSEGHEFMLAPSDLKHGKNGGHWCAKCSGNARMTVEDMKEIAVSRGGECLSSIYFNAQQALSWRCNYGHEWTATYNNVRKGVWCPQCKVSLGENLVRCVFEQIFKRKFPNIRPSWLRSKGGTKLELDGYCEDLRLAFEHQGVHHYKIDGYFVRDAKKLNKRIQADIQKQEICKQNKITLILIPEVGRLTSIENLRDNVLNECKSLGVLLPRGAWETQIDYKPAYIVKYWNELQEIARQNGGEILSKGYIGMQGKYLVECANGHRWEVRGQSIKRGSWCKRCYLGENK